MCALQECSLCLPQYSRHAGLQGQMLWELLVSVPDPQARESDMGLRTLIPMGELLQCNCFQPGGTSGKKSVCQCRKPKRRGFSTWVGKILWRKAWQSTLVFLPGESYGQGSLAGYGP